MPRTTKRQQQASQEPTEIHDDPMSWMRSYQREVLTAFFLDGKDRFVLADHRKSGKDYLWAMIAKMFMLNAYGNEGRSPLVIHALTTFKKAKETIWDGPCDKGRFIDVVFPPAIRAEFSETECMIRLKDGFGTKTGPIYQLQGAAEQYQNKRGPNATGVILSEIQDMPAGIFEEIYEPMIVSNRGWAAFIGTPRGKNHFWKKAQYAAAESRKPQSRWFFHSKTIADTRRDAPGESGDPVVDPKEIAEMRREGRDEAIILQEYYCSFEGTLQGSIFGAYLRTAEQEKRVVRVLREANQPVGCCLDIGRSDGTAIWFYQTIAREVRLIDYLAFTASHLTNMSAAEYAIKRICERPYWVTRIILPHDAAVKGYSATDSTEDLFRRAFQDVVCDESKLSVEQGLERVRAAFPRFYFDLDKCGMPQDNDLPSGIESLRGYHRAWNPATGQWDGLPVHDAASHGADALRYGAMEGFTPLEFPGHREARPVTVETTFSLYGRQMGGALGSPQARG